MSTLSADTGILITNLGTPDAATATAVRRYLREFLSDRRVIDYPRFLWWLILNGIILPLRPQRSARAYQKIWTAEGSPLRIISQRQLQGLQALFAERNSHKVCIALGMRYGNPSIKNALNELRLAKIKRLLILPLYPQYSATTTASTFDAVAEELKTWRHLPELRMINHYAEAPEYIQVLATSIKHHREKNGSGQQLLFSFHGIPKRYTDLGDPYYQHCHATASLVAKTLDLPASSWSVAFQSRFGREKWLTPYCDLILKKMPAQGIESIDVICPGFAADCLETLEEMAMQNCDIFMKAGGKKFSYIPALNDSVDHLQALVSVIDTHAGEWLKGA